MSECRFPVLLDERGLTKALTLGMTTIKKISDFPRPIQLTGIRVARWRTSDVLAWAERQAVRDEGVPA